MSGIDGFIHDVTAIELGDVERVDIDGSVSRRLRIETEDGTDLKVTLFADVEDQLKVALKTKTKV